MYVMAIPLRFQSWMRSSYIYGLNKIQHHYSLTNAFQWVFRIKPIAKSVFKVQNFLEDIRFPSNPYY